MELFQLQEADFHITMECTGRCPYCYRENGPSNHTATPFSQCSGKAVDPTTQLEIIKRLHAVAGVNDLVLVGGDPCEHPNIVSLLRCAKSVGMYTCALSNTHIYHEDGRRVDMGNVLQYLDEVNFTLHGKDAATHDSFNGSPGSYSNASTSIRSFMSDRKPNQKVGIVLNLIPETTGQPNQLYDIMGSAVQSFGLVPGQDHFIIQRIAPAGRGRDNYKRWKLTPEMVEYAFDTFDCIEQKYGVSTDVIVDAFPWCIVPERHHHYLKDLSGGCNWGQPGGVISVLPDGTLQRCALCHGTLGANILDFKTPEEFSEFMWNHPGLQAFRGHQHLADQCRKCELLEKCGGGCVLANHTPGVAFGDPYLGDEPCRQGMDYLAKPSSLRSSHS